MLVAWEESDTLTTIALVLAVLVPFGLWRLDKASRDKDARERAAEREADRAERQAERRSAVVDVRLVYREGREPDESGHGWKPVEEWWRLSLVGGNAFSRVTVTTFEMRNVGTDEPWEPAALTWPGPVTLGAGQTVHLMAAIAVNGTPEINVRWTHDGDDESGFRRRVFEEPWT